MKVEVKTIKQSVNDKISFWNTSLKRNLKFLLLE